jgi:hypothetical protein
MLTFFSIILYNDFEFVPLVSFWVSWLEFYQSKTMGLSLFQAWLCWVDLHWTATHASLWVPLVP